MGATMIDPSGDDSWSSSRRDSEREELRRKEQEREQRRRTLEKKEAEKRRSEALKLSDDPQLEKDLEKKTPVKIPPASTEAQAQALRTTWSALNLSTAKTLPAQIDTDSRIKDFLNQYANALEYVAETCRLVEETQDPSLWRRTKETIGRLDKTDLRFERRRLKIKWAPPSDAELDAKRADEAGDVSRNIDTALSALKHFMEVDTPIEKEKLQAIAELNHNLSRASLIFIRSQDDAKESPELLALLRQLYRETPIIERLAHPEGWQAFAGEVEALNERRALAALGMESVSAIHRPWTERISNQPLTAHPVITEASSTQRQRERS